MTGGAVPDVVAAIREIAAREPIVLHIGTDSQETSRNTDYVSVIVALTPGHGGRVFYRRHATKRTRSLAQRLFKEAALSLEVAQVMAEQITPEITVHVDANEDLRHRSSNYVQALAGMVVGYGFRVRLKPDSWCATHVADRLVKVRRPSAA
jgi:predicted RNase H-related nuclease YkuK (DUF458 family)